MKILITGHRGFIASNLPTSLRELYHEVIDPSQIKLSHRIHTGEHCVHNNSENDWYNEFKRLNVDVVIHNAASVDRKSTRLNSSHVSESRMPSSA